METEAVQDGSLQIPWILRPFLRVYAYLCAALDGMPVKYRKVA